MILKNQQNNNLYFTNDFLHVITNQHYKFSQLCYSRLLTGFA